jgi:hypothetical protein
MSSLRQALEIVKKPDSDLSVRHLAGRLLGEVTPISLRQFIERAEPIIAALEQFEQSTQSGVWPHILKNDLIENIRAAVAEPLTIHQKYTPLCGPAAIVFELVSRQPHRYIQICQQLYETDQFQGRTKEVKPSQTLVESQIPKNPELGGTDIRPADWMLLATLRDVENLLFPVDADSGQLVMGVTTPWEMKGWAFEILGYNQIAYESTYSYGEFDAMRLAEKARNNGGVAFLMIHSAMLGKAEPLVSYPDHWVSFLGNLTIDSGHIKFDCYSWGENKHVDLDKESFEKYMCGVVTGEC